MKDHLESLKRLRRSVVTKPGTDQFAFFFFGRATPTTLRVGVAASEEEVGGKIQSLPKRGRDRPIQKRKNFSKKQGQ